MILEGIRILDFGRYVAAPWCAALLADYGADVIRIEKPEGNEDRYLVPVSEDGTGALFLQSNRGKRSLTLDIGSPQGRAIVTRLVATADVVLANMPEDALATLGLDYASLSAIRPDIILANVTAFGGRGPLARNVGFDGVAQAMSGVAYLSGNAAGPSRAQVTWVDFGTAAHCAFAIMIALLERQKTGRGQVIAGSLLATAAACANSTLIEQAMLKIDRPPMGNRSPTSGPTDIYSTADGSVLTQVVGNPLFRRWAKLVDRTELLDDPRFGDDSARGVHGEALSEIMGGWCAARTTAEALAALALARIPASPVLTPQQALDHPQMVASDIFHPMEHPGLPGPAPVARAPIELSVTAVNKPTHAPLLGEHNEQILSEIGCSAAEIDALRQSHII
jgi:crotonobetainyl-CoA:carnitine CoA-transferase CaiB-like acyl-CoA transferase